MKGSFLLELMPLLLEDVQGFRHFKLEHEVSYEVIDDHITAKSLWDCLCYSCSLAGGILLGCFFHLSLNFECIEVIEVIIVLDEALHR